MKNTSLVLKAGRRCSVNAIALFALLAILTSPSAHALNSVVNSTMDPTEAGKTTLRGAITATNAAGGTNTITFDATVFPTAGPAQTITLASALPAINSNLTITGPNANVLTVSGASTFRVFAINAARTVSISGLTIANGQVIGTTGNMTNPPTNGLPAMGGGILNSGSLTLTLCVLSGNICSGGMGGTPPTKLNVNGAAGADGLGGAIYSDGTALSIVRCTFSGNTVSGGSGGAGSSVEVDVGQLSGNGGPAANGKGGAIYVAAGTFSALTSTFVTNTANGGKGGDGGYPNLHGGQNPGGVGGNGEGGAIYTVSAATITSCTIGSNAANPGNGGDQVGSGGNAAAGISRAGGIRGTATTTVGNTIIAENTSTNPKTLAVTKSDVFGGTFTSANFNLIGVPDATVTTFTGSADQKGTVAAPINPKLDPLGAANNGGTVTTVRLRKGSPAVDKGNNLTSGIDQIGSPRPVNLSNTIYPNAPGGDGSDIGALEAQTLPNDIPTTNDQQFNGVQGTAFSGVQMTASDGDGDTLTFSVVSGTMPQGLTLNPNGTITGTPTGITLATGTIVMFKVNDGLADSTTNKLTLTISERLSTVVNGFSDTQSPYDGVTTLREAVNNAPQLGGNPVVTFDAAVFATARTITLTNGTISVGNNLTINGTTAGVTISGNDAVGVFQCFGSGGATAINFNGLTISHGRVGAGSQGSGIRVFNAGSLPTVTLRNCTLSDNGGPDTQGGAICNDGGTIILINCTLANNHCDFTSLAASGGAILQNSGTMTLQNCTIYKNQANGAGGSGGGIKVVAGTVNLGNSIVAQNTAATGADISGTVVSQNYNLIGVTTGATINGTTTENQLNVTIVNQALDTNLANNGGPTQTIRLNTGSFAIDKGNTLGGVTTDQRGIARPADDTAIANATGGDGGDIGAYEVPIAGAPAPEIAVEYPLGTDRADGGAAVPLGNVEIGTTADFVFTIKNIGTLPLKLTGTPTVALSGANASLFRVNVQPDVQVAASSSTTFTVRFAPDTVGVKTAALSIDNDDGNENPFNLALTVTGIDTITQTPVFTSPASFSTVGNPITVSFTLPEAAKTGTLKLTFDDGLTQKVLTLGTAQETAGAHSFSFDPSNPTATPTDIASGVAIPDGTYTQLLFQYQDVPGNPAAFVTRNNVKVDTSTIAPTITGTLANQPVNDNATIQPFLGVTIDDANVSIPAQNVTFTLSDTATGSITALSGFSDAGGGVFTFFGTPTAATAAIRGVVFTPANNKLAASLTELASFTITSNNGIAPTTTDTTTSVLITSVNDAPAVTINGAPTAVSVGTAVNLTSTVTDPDTAETAAFAWAVTKNGAAFGSAATAAFSFTPDAAGSYVVTLTVTDSSTATGNATATVAAVASTLTLDSAPTATPNPAAAGQTVTFNVSVTSSSAVTFAWNFGDGTTGTGAPVTHAFSTAQTYTVTVVATNADGLSVNGSVLVAVTPPVVVIPPVIGTGADLDKDGFSDSFETAAGTNPADPASTPIGGAPATAGAINATDLIITKATVKLNFTKQGPTDKHADSIAFSGTVAVPAAFNITSKPVVVDIGGVIKTFTLDAKGKGSAKTADGSVKITVKAKKGVVAAQAAKIQVTLPKGAFAAALADEGLVGTVDIKKPPKSVQVLTTVIFNNTILQKNLVLDYTARAGKSGAAKLPPKK